ncbi:synaptogyrin-3-like [Ostrea edulis]|uniref:synaptogyrin-3-like n=1 Tax=Ostrea edulis TaxID=37623 RepID=UPI002094A4F5|nr:synaptogyrin-3-like [Ostrea edulis]
MSTGDGGAFGAGMAGAPFDPVQFIKKPQVILRLASTLFAIIVFGCILGEGWISDKCLMNNDANACGYGTGIGIIAFLLCLGFLVLDAMFENISSVQYRKYVVLADMGISGLWTFLWFVGFCYMTDAWRKTDQVPPHGYGRNNIQAAIAFSFFSIITWGGITFFAVRRYREGFGEAFAQRSSYDDQTQSSPYSSFPGSETGDPYQQPPFTSQKETPDFQQPTY